jgi:hypothetical protein
MAYLSSGRSDDQGGQQLRTTVHSLPGVRWPPACLLRSCARTPRARSRPPRAMVGPVLRDVSDSALRPIRLWSRAVRGSRAVVIAIPSPREQCRGQHPEKWPGVTCPQGIKADSESLPLDVDRRNPWALAELVSVVTAIRRECDESCVSVREPVDPL